MRNDNMGESGSTVITSLGPVLTKLGSTNYSSGTKFEWTREKKPDEYLK